MYRRVGVLSEYSGRERYRHEHELRAPVQTLFALLFRLPSVANDSYTASDFIRALERGIFLANYVNSLLAVESKAVTSGQVRAN